MGPPAKHSCNNNNVRRHDTILPHHTRYSSSAFMIVAALASKLQYTFNHPAQLSSSGHQVAVLFQRSSANYEPSVTIVDHPRHPQCWIHESFERTLASTDTTLPPGNMLMMPAGAWFDTWCLPSNWIQLTLPQNRTNHRITLRHVTASEVKDRCTIRRQVIHDTNGSNDTGETHARVSRHAPTKQFHIAQLLHRQHSCNHSKTTHSTCSLPASKA